MYYSLKDLNRRKQIRIEPKCDYLYRYPQNEKSILIKENDFFVSEGKEWFDIIRFQDVANFAISKKVRTLLYTNKITGWGCFPINIEGYEEKEYFGFQILSEKAGRILNLQQLNDLEENHIKFDIKSWDGSDFFTLSETGITACSKKVKELFEKEKITNVSFNPMLTLNDEEKNKEQLKRKRWWQGKKD